MIFFGFYSSDTTLCPRSAFCPASDTFSDWRTRRTFKKKHVTIIGVWVRDVFHSVASSEDGEEFVAVFFSRTDRQFRCEIFFFLFVNPFPVRAETDFLMRVSVYYGVLGIYFFRHCGRRTHLTNRVLFVRETHRETAIFTRFFFFLYCRKRYRRCIRKIIRTAPLYVIIRVIY